MAKNKNKSRNLYKSFGLSSSTEQQFNRAIKRIVKELRLKCDPVAQKHGDNIHVISGPVTYVFEQEGKLGYQLKPKLHTFSLFQNGKKYHADYVNYTSELFEQILVEEIGCSKKELLNNNKDNWRFNKAAKTLCQLAPKPEKTFSDLNRIFLNLVWKEFDDTAREIAIKSLGMGTTSFDVSMIAQNIDEVKGIFETTPGIIPLWLYSRHKDYMSQCGYISCYSDIKRDESNPDKYDYGLYGNGVVNECKEFLVSIDAYSKPIWKMICKMKPRWVRGVLAKCKRSRLGLTLKTLAEIGYIPRYTALLDFASDSMALGMQLELVYAKGLVHNLKNPYIHALRSCFKTSHERLARTQWSDISLVADWIRSEKVVLDRNQQNASWKWFMNQQESWHEREALRRYEIEEERIKNYSEKEKKSRSWDSLLEPYKIKGYDIVPITTAIELFKEGEALSHCVGSSGHYRYMCSKGEAQIISIRKENKSLVTLMISKSGDSWRLGQVSGYKNNRDKPLSKEFKKIAEMITLKYNGAQKKYDKEEAKRLKDEAKEKEEARQEELVLV